MPLLVGLAACAAPAAGETAGDDVVKIGVVGKGDPQWAAFEEAAAEAGITIELVDFADYAQPNPATTEGELDLNQFQHIVYLADYNVSAGEDLAPIGSTAIYPLGLYSTKYDSVEDIPEGETVAVPNDASNQARALLVLQSAGLIELKSGGTIFSDLADIDEAKSKVKVTALEASLTPTSLPDVAAAIINNDFVRTPASRFEDAIAQDDPSDPNALPYVNIFAARAEDEDNETYLKLVEIFQTDPEVQAGLLEASGGTAVPVDDPGRRTSRSRSPRSRPTRRPRRADARDRSDTSIATRAGGGRRTGPTARLGVPEGAPMALVSLTNVTKTYPAADRGGAPVVAVDDVSLDIEPGDVFGIIGYSGAGKSTLVRLVNALEPATSGSIMVDGRDLTEMPERELRGIRLGIGMIFQQFNLFGSKTVWQNVAYPLKVAGASKAEIAARVAELLDFVGLADKARNYPDQLSGGQKQRVGIARALATSPRLLLADEATSALDPETTQEVLALLKRVNREFGVTIIVITHEMDVIQSIATKVAVMDGGRVIETATCSTCSRTRRTPRRSGSSRRSSRASRRRPSSPCCASGTRVASSRSRSATATCRRRRCSSSSRRPGSSSSSCTAASTTSRAARSGTSPSRSEARMPRSTPRSRASPNASTSTEVAD